NALPQTAQYEDIHVPVNTPMGFYIGMLCLIFGFATTWYIWWLSALSFAGIIACLIIRLSGKDTHMIISVDEVKKIEMECLLRGKGI
ncbi:MAG: cytochrome o ubiquinol oxidase subunit I, partial [Verrucomicrobia bacterium]|nr:cytochrome o ubiquinol oxidase subunit I [Verrucomicrobiota bacterium]